MTALPLHALPHFEVRPPRARILMVDDHAPNLVALEAILGPLGEELVPAHSGKDALRHLLENPDFAIILLDVQMPGIDGIETAQLIKQHPRTRQIPILFLTAVQKNEQQIFRGYRLGGAVDYLTKPFDPEILKAKVAVFVDLWRKRALIERQARLLREQELEDLERRKEVRYRALTDSMPLSIWIADRRGEVHHCNRGWQNYTGAKSIQLLPAVHPDERRDFEAAWVAAVASGSPLERELRLQRKDGAWRWHLLRVVPDRDEDGRLAGFIATATDIDDQKRAEHSHADLAERERAARERAEQMGRAKDEFLATVSHELRTPLNAILGWVRMLRDGAVDPARQGRALETIERNARAQTQLIDDILDVSRIVAGKLRLRPRPLELREVVQSALEAVRPAAQAKAIELSLVGEGAGHCLGDPDRLQQVAWNLLSNAVKFASEGGKVTVRLSEDAGFAQLEVVDDGPGISPEFLPYVFDRFRQADSSVSRAQGGLGLGLAIVRHLVELHGGRVEAFSEGLGKGARFVVRLPVGRAAEAGSETAERPPDSAPPPPRLPSAVSGVLSGLRVLVVDDEADACDLAQHALELHGANVACVHRAADALELIKSDTIDVLVSDIGMPVSDGFTLLQAVRALDGSAAEVPALALTAMAIPRIRALEMGFQDHLAKPADPAALCAAVAALAGRQADAPPRGRAEGLPEAAPGAPLAAASVAAGVN